MSQMSRQTRITPYAATLTFWFVSLAKFEILELLTLISDHKATYVSVRINVSVKLNTEKYGTIKQLNT